MVLSLTTLGVFVVQSTTFCLKLVLRPDSAVFSYRCRDLSLSLPIVDVCCFSPFPNLCFSLSRPVCLSVVCLSACPSVCPVCPSLRSCVCPCLSVHLHPRTKKFEGSVWGGRVCRWKAFDKEKVKIWNPVGTRWYNTRLTSPGLWTLWVLRTGGW